MEKFRLTRSTYNDFLYLMRKKTRRKDDFTKARLEEAGWEFTEEGDMMVMTPPIEARRYNRMHKHGLYYVKKSLSVTDRSKPGAPVRTYNRETDSAQQVIDSVFESEPAQTEAEPTEEPQAQQEPDWVFSGDSDVNDIPEGAIVRVINNWSLTSLSEGTEFRVSATELSKWLEQSRRQVTVKFIEENRPELEQYGAIDVRRLGCRTSMPNGGTRIYYIDEPYLNEDQALIVAMRAGTAKAKEVRFQLVMAYKTLKKILASMSQPAALNEERLAQLIAQSTATAVTTALATVTSKVDTLSQEVAQQGQQISYINHGGLHAVPPTGYISFDLMIIKLNKEHFHQWVAHKAKGMCWNRKDGSPSDVPFKCPNTGHIHTILKLYENNHTKLAMTIGKVNYIKESAEQFLVAMFNVWLSSAYGCGVKGCGSSHMTDGGVLRTDFYTLNPVEWRNIMKRLGYSKKEANDSLLRIEAKIRATVETYAPFAITG